MEMLLTDNQDPWDHYENENPWLFGTIWQFEGNVQPSDLEERLNDPNTYKISLLSTCQTTQLLTDHSSILGLLGEKKESIWLPVTEWSRKKKLCYTKKSGERAELWKCSIHTFGACLQIVTDWTLTLKVLNFWKFTSCCSLKPLQSGWGEVVPARPSLTLHPPSPPTVHQLSQLAL